MNEYTNSLTRVPKKCLDYKMRLVSQIQNISDNIEALFWVSREGLLVMRKLNHFLSHAHSSLLRHCVMT